MTASGVDPASVVTIAAEGDITPLGHVEKAGHGPVPMVLIPGFACDWTVYKTFMERNGDRYAMYAVTLPGFGGTNPPPSMPAGEHGAWLDNAAAAIAAMIKADQLDRPVVVGHSMGGMLALRLAAEHPDLVRAAVSLDGMPAYPVAATDVTVEQRKEMIKLNFEPVFGPMTDEQWKAGQRQYVLPMVTDPKRGEELVALSGLVPKDVAVAYMLDLMSADYRPLLTRIGCPTLLLATEKKGGPWDQYRDNSRKLWNAAKDKLSKGTLVTFGDTAHFVMDDRPGELDETIDAFVQGRPVHDVPGEEPVVPHDPAPAASPNPE